MGKQREQRAPPNTHDLFGLDLFPFIRGSERPQNLQNTEQLWRLYREKSGAPRHAGGRRPSFFKCFSVPRTAYGTGATKNSWPQLGPLTGVQGPWHKKNLITGLRFGFIEMPPCNLRLETSWGKPSLSGGIKTVLLLMAVSLFFPGCGEQDVTLEPRYGTNPESGAGKILTLAVHPLYNPLKLIRSYQPLVDFLNSRIKTHSFALESSRDYGSFEDKYASGKPDLLLPNPWQTLQAMKFGYHVIASAGDPDDFKGLILVRRDSGIRVPEDLVGKAVSYPSKTAVAACIMPQYFLYSQGIDVNKDIINRYVGSQESSIMNVYLGMTSAGATWPPPWRIFQKDHPQEASSLMVLWQTDPLVNNSFMVKEDLSPELRTRILLALASLTETVEGQVLLAGMETSQFIPANDRDYDRVRTYIDRFEKAVRRVNE